MMTFQKAQKDTKALQMAGWFAFWAKTGDKNMGFIRHTGKQKTRAGEILLHLTQFRDDNDYFAPGQTNQDGIAAALGISRAHACLAIQKLVNAGLVVEAMRHTGTPPKVGKKRRCYFLTATGIEMAAKIRDF